MNVAAFVMWKEDLKDKTKGKMKALLKVSSWLNGILPKEEEAEEDSEEEVTVNSCQFFVFVPTCPYRCLLLCM